VLSILGKSGCGKTTLLKIIAGLEHSKEGELQLADQDLTLLAAQQREIVYLYQEPLLFPHLNVFENLAFGLRLRKESKTRIQEKTMKMLLDLELEKEAKRMPQALSGGQRQRVAFGRALIINPKVLLLDEPFGNLDAQTRANMQSLFKKVSEKFNITAVFVTHDLKEALLMGDDFGYMAAGKLEVYKDKKQFLTDTRTGIQEELDFWKTIENAI